MVCYPKIQSKALKDDLHPDIMDKLEKDWRVSLSKRKRGGEGE